MKNVLKTISTKKEIMVGNVRIFVDDIGYHLSNGEKQKTVHWLSHIPEAIKQIS